MATDAKGWHDIWQPVEELRRWLDTQIITSDTIGDVRRRLFVPWDSAWNGIVRDETAKRERSSDGREDQP